MIRTARDLLKSEGILSSPTKKLENKVKDDVEELDTKNHNFFKLLF
jgi:hypothetical protein